MICQKNKLIDFSEHKKIARFSVPENHRFSWHSQKPKRFLILRCFIAVDIPEKAREEIVKVQKILEKRNLFMGKLTEKENLHLTLKFLGEIDEGKVGDVKKKLKEIKFSRFKVKLREIGVFSEDFVRIIWAHLSGKGVLELQKEIDEKLDGFFPKEKRFMSHLTIARVKSVKNREKLLEELSKIKLNCEFEVDRFFLKKSTLTGEGPIYENLLELNLS